MEFHKQPPKGYRMLICLTWNKHYLGIHSYVAESEPTNDKMFIMSVPFEEIYEVYLDKQLGILNLYPKVRKDKGIAIAILASIICIPIFYQFKKQLKAHLEHCI